MCERDNPTFISSLSVEQDLCNAEDTLESRHLDKTMDKVYKEYKRQLSAGTASFTESDVENGFPMSHTAIRVDEALTNKEKQYLVAVERGDMASTKHYLEMSEEDSLFNMNCRDPMGRSALLIAIEYENIEMMELLLSFNVEVRDALLHAINEENVEAVELLLKYKQTAPKHKNLQMNSSNEDLFLGESQSDSFTPDITPLMLAAHRDNYEIIKILLERGDRIPKPHNVQCPCKDCAAYRTDDILCHSRSRINAYKALASPSLICLSSRDPILTAFELSWELRTLAQLEPEFKSTYKNLSKQVQEFATELLDQTRGSEELETILNHDTESPMSEDDTEVMTLSRLRLAIKYKQKEFVAHPHCQQLLASIWYEGLPGFRRLHIAYRILMICTIGVLAPLWAILYILAPMSIFGKLMRKPFIKFIIHSASYIIFLFLLILTSQRIDFSPNSSNKGRKSEYRGATPNVIEWLITCWVIGLVWSEMKQLWNAGFKEYILDMWNILDFTTNTLYIATITLRTIAYLKVQEERALNLPSADIERKHWNAYDPNLIAEALFAAANIFSALKLVFIFSINPYLGPLQISLGRMVVDITKFGVIYFLVNFSFACGLNQLFWYYSMSRQLECEAKPELCDPNHNDSKFLRFFPDLFEIMQTLYWALFGLVGLDTMTLKEDHSFTQLAGKTMFGVYSYISIIVLINMLIAMMNTSYQIISSQEDTEWKFARSKLWMTYFEDGGTLPAPFNVIPTPKTIISLFLYIKELICRCSVKHKRNRWQSIKKIVKKINEREKKYQVVMRNLIKRYIMNKSRCKIEEGVTDDDVNEIKQDISSFRYELLEVLRNNGMDIPNYNRKNNKIGSKRSKRWEVGRKLTFGYCVNKKNNLSNRPTLLSTQTESLGSSGEEAFEVESKPNHHSSHAKLIRSKLGQVVAKAFHRHKSTSQDLGDDEKSMELSTTNIDLPTCSEDSKSKSPGTPLMTDSTLDVSQCPSEEPLLPSKDKMADDRHSQRNKLFATSKHGALY